MVMKKYLNKQLYILNVSSDGGKDESKIEISTWVSPLFHF